MAMGYMGFARFDGSVVLATGSSVNLILEPIYSSSVWGAGWGNAATSAHYADNAIRYEGNIDLELQFGAGGVVWDFIRNWIIYERNEPQNIDISPDGTKVYEYNTGQAGPPEGGAWNTSASFSTSEGSPVTASFGCVALNRAETAGSTYDLNEFGEIAGACAANGFSDSNPLNPGGANLDPIPYWQTKADLLVGTYGAGVLPQLDMETVEWSIDLNQNYVLVYTCNGSRLPSAMMQGPMDVSGNIVVYRQDGVFDPILGPGGTGTPLAPYAYADNTELQIQIGPQVLNKITMPAVVIEGDDYGIPGQDAVVNRSFNLKGLGGRCVTDVALPPMTMAAYTAPV